MIPQEEMNVIENLIETELTNLFTIPGFIEGQYRFDGRETPVQEQEFANSIIDLSTGAAMEYRHLMKDDKKICKHLFENELGRLAQGVGKRVKGTDTILFVEYESITIEIRRDNTYGRIVVEYRPKDINPTITNYQLGKISLSNLGI